MKTALDVKGVTNPQKAGRFANQKPERMKPPVLRAGGLFTVSSIQVIDWQVVGGVDGTRTRGLRRDRPAF